MQCCMAGPLKHRLQQQEDESVGWRGQGGAGASDSCLLQGCDGRDEGWVGGEGKAGVIACKQGDEKLSSTRSVITLVLSI